MITAENISKKYGEGTSTGWALNKVSFSIKEGEICLISGKSGSGKSTLLRQLSLLDSPTTGQIFLEHTDTSSLTERDKSYMRLMLFGYIFQEDALLSDLSVAENVYLPQLQLITGHRGQLKKRAIALLELVGLHNLHSKRVTELSGGERQRVAIARALINQPKIVFADEPTASLDSLSSMVVMHVLTKLNRDLGTTIVFVSHDPDHIGYASRHLILSDGKLSGTQL